MKLTSAHGSVLLTADIEQQAEEELLERAADLKADVLIAPHHGSKTSSTQAFIEAVDPDQVIFTVGYRNRFGHPKEEVVQRYVDLQTEIYRSDRHGAVLLKLGDKSGINTVPWRLHDKRYWRE